MLWKLYLGRLCRFHSRDEYLELTHEKVWLFCLILFLEALDLDLSQDGLSRKLARFNRQNWIKGKCRLKVIYLATQLSMLPFTFWRVIKKMKAFQNVKNKKKGQRRKKENKRERERKERKGKESPPPPSLLPFPTCSASMNTIRGRFGEPSRFFG